jgi:hypothetical protein
MPRNSVVFGFQVGVQGVSHHLFSDVAYHTIHSQRVQIHLAPFQERDFRNSAVPVRLVTDFTAWLSDHASNGRAGINIDVPFSPSGT